MFIQTSLLQANQYLTLFTISQNEVIPYIHYLSLCFSIFTVTLPIQAIFLWQWMVLINTQSIFTGNILKPNYLP